MTADELAPDAELDLILTVNKGSGRFAARRVPAALRLFTKRVKLARWLGRYWSSLRRRCSSRIWRRSRGRAEAVAHVRIKARDVLRGAGVVGEPYSCRPGT